jgi:hypothetical protein
MLLALSYRSRIQLIVGKPKENDTRVLSRYRLRLLAVTCPFRAGFRRLALSLSSCP